MFDDAIRPKTLVFAVFAVSAVAGGALSCGSSSSGSSIAAAGSVAVGGGPSASSGATNAGAAAGGRAATGGAGAVDAGGEVGAGGEVEAGGSAGNAAGAAGTAGATHTREEISTKYNYAPATRTVQPVAIFKTNGSVVNPKNVLTGAATAIVGKGAYVVLDFGKEVGGIISLSFAAASDANQSVGLAFRDRRRTPGRAVINRTAAARPTEHCTRQSLARARTPCLGNFCAAAFVT